MVYGKICIIKNDECHLSEKVMKFILSIWSILYSYDILIPPLPPPPPFPPPPPPLLPPHFPFLNFLQFLQPAGNGVPLHVVPPDPPPPDPPPPEPPPEVP